MASGITKKIPATILEYILSNITFDEVDNTFYDRFLDKKLSVFTKYVGKDRLPKSSCLRIEGSQISAMHVAYIIANRYQYDGRIYPVNGDRSDCRKDNMFLVDRVSSSTLLTSERVRYLLNYDTITGELTWVNETMYGTKSAGYSDKKGYLAIGVDGRLYAYHRVVWLHYYGKWPDNYIDHKDGNPLNNAIVNLRDVTMAVNAQNKRSAPSNAKSTKVLGVYLHKSGRYQAQIKKDKIWYNCGIHDTIEEAHAAYVAMKRKIHPGNML